jgi:hypothetical protein
MSFLRTKSLSAIGICSDSNEFGHRKVFHERSAARHRVATACFPAFSAYPAASRARKKLAHAGTLASYHSPICWQPGKR